MMPISFTSRGAGVVALSVVLSGVLAFASRAADDRVTTSPEKSGAVSFYKDVLPIFQRSCQNCHRPGLIAPMSLLTYDSTRPWAKSIQKRVASREMPPWHIDRSIGEYYPDPSLSDAEISTIVRWVDSGARAGNPADAPPPVEFPSPEEWQFGKPDLVVTMPEPYVVPAEGSDQFVDFIFPSGLTEDRYIKWIEIKPSKEGRRALHHVLAHAMDGDTLFGSLLIEYAVGNNGDIYHEGTGKLLKAGADIRFESHYHSVGEEISDRASIAFGLYPKGYIPKGRVISSRIFAGLPGAGHTYELDIPAGANNVRHEGIRWLREPTMVLSFQAHMHFRGKAMNLEAIHLDGSKEPLTRITNYDYRWQVAYPYRTPPVFPKGTVLHVTSWHDNSKNNPDNPNHRVDVKFGTDSEDEMAIGWTNYVHLEEEDYEAIVAARSAGEDWTKILSAESDDR